MLNEIKLFRIMIAALLLLSLPILSSCSRVKTRSFNDSDQIMSGDAYVQPPIPNFEWVCMSKGRYRNITTVNP